MPIIWSFTQLIEYNFHQVASVIFRKYPNPYSPHVISVDVVDRSIDPETGVLRTERIIGVKQPTPKWVSTIMGGSGESYAREVAFIIPSSSAASDTSPPQILLSSINMSFNNLLTCYERISYTASARRPNENTEMHTVAEISAQGSLKTGVAAKRIGKKFEEYSMDKYVDNSHVGREGLDSVLGRFYPDPTKTPSTHHL